MDRNYKQMIVDEIEHTVSVFKPVSAIRFRIRCPFCGDSDKDPRDAHFYIKCSDDITEPLLYKCFLCNKKGIINKQVLEMLGVDKAKAEKLTSGTNHVHKVVKNIKYSNVSITDTPNLNSLQVKYIEDRLGPGFTYNDYERFRIVWNLSDLFPYLTQRVRNTLPNNNETITFLTDDKAMLATRYFDDNKGRWKKITISNTDQQSYYLIKSTFNLFTSEEITVSIAEGIFDILSAYKNFNGGENAAYLATLGSDYASGIDYIISKGIVGSNVTVKVYMDDNIDLRKMKMSLKRFKPFFGKIVIYVNIKYKDIGVTPDMIRLKEEVV